MSFFTLRDSNPTAAKDHICIWCGEAINKGDKYFRQTGIFDGDFQSNAWHPECFDDGLVHDIEDGFVPYENERPKSVGGN